MLHEAQPDADAAGGQNQQAAARDRNKKREKLRQGFLPIENKVGALTEHYQQDRWNEKQAADRYPKNAERMKMPLQARLNQSPSWVSDPSAALGAKHEIWLPLSSAAIAEHRASLNHNE